MVPKQIVESIIAGKMLEANDMLDAKLSEIRERKLYEMKRMFQAEAFGGLTKAEIEMRKKAGYRKAADVLGDPWSKRKKKIPLPDMKKEKKIGEESLDEMRAPGEIPGSVERNQAASNLRSVRSAIRNTGDKEADTAFRSEYLKTRKAQIPKPAPETSSGYQRPGRLQRNINTLKGRQPGYVDDRSEEDKLKEKGGRLGKFARKVGDVTGNVAKQLADIGTSNLN